MNVLLRAKQVVQSGKAVALLRVSKVSGSAPREKGAVMLVTDEGIHGSIGGGVLEWRAMVEAQRLISKGPSVHCSTYALGPDLGQCCGGQVEVVTQIFDASNVEAMPDVKQAGRTVYLFGAGHVGKALIFVLAATEFELVWCDPRPGAFPNHLPGNVVLRSDQDCSAVIGEASAGSIVFVMSHSHALDLAIVDCALRNTNVVATGLIGSATKRARFEKRLAAAGVEGHRIDELICPIGIAGIRSKQPEAIAISTAAQLMMLDESLSYGKSATSGIGAKLKAAS